MGDDGNGRVVPLHGNGRSKHPASNHAAAPVTVESVSSPLADRIRELAGIHGYTLRGLAKAAGVGENVVLQLSAGNTKAPRRDNLILIANVLHVDPMELLELAGVVTEDDRWMMARPTFQEFVMSPHLPLTFRRRRILIDLYESWTGGPGGSSGLRAR